MTAAHGAGAAFARPLGTGAASAGLGAEQDRRGRAAPGARGDPAAGAEAGGRAACRSVSRDRDRRALDCGGDPGGGGGACGGDGAGLRGASGGRGRRQLPWQDFRSS
jgi:hypothetical protein